MFIAGLGAVFFGFIIGWIAYQILRRRSGTHELSDLIVIVGTIGGAAVLAIRSEVLFGWYSIGLVIGFFAYLAVDVTLHGKQEVRPWRQEQIAPPPTSYQESGTHTD
jgi:hypothetical protein